MNKLVSPAAAMAMLGAFSLPSMAEEANVPALLRQAKCYACHDMEATLIGPSYKAIALRHAEDGGNAVDGLAIKIVQGGGGNWGVVPMVPNDHVAEADALAMAKWILAQE